MTKPKKLFQWLKNGQCKSEVIAVCDSWDAVWQKSPESAAKEFLDLGYDIIIGAERNCWPFPELASKHPECASSFRFLNTGLIIGKPQAILELLQDSNAEGQPDDHVGPDGKGVHPCDQGLVMKSFLGEREHPERNSKIRLDTETKFILNLHGVKEGELGWGSEPIWCVETGNVPYMLHFNGGSKTDGLREPILKKLNLPL